MEESQQIRYRGVEMSAPVGLREFFNIFGGDHGVQKFSQEVKGHIEYCRVLQHIFNERGELEESYSNKLKKLSAKLISAIAYEKGGISASVKAVAMLMAEEGCQHAELGKTCTETINSVLKSVVKSFEKTLKNVDKQLEKLAKKYNDKQASVRALKKKCFKAANEGKKDTLKADGEYYNKAFKSECLRAELELVTYKTVAILESLEKLRLSEIHNACISYYSHMASCLMRSYAFINEIEPTISGASVICDLMHAVNSRQSTASNYIDQPLVDFAAEEMHLSMDQETRVASLTQYQAWARECLDNEGKTKTNLMKALQGMDVSCPNGRQNVEETRNQLILSSASQDYLEACEWKFQTLLAAINGTARAAYPNGNYIVRERDSNQQGASILRLPLKCVMQDMSCQISFVPPTPKPVTAPAVSPGLKWNTPSGYIRSLANYDSRRDCELSLRKGDNVFIMLPWDRLWWLAVLGNRIGEVPSECFVETVIEKKHKNNRFPFESDPFNELTAIEKIPSGS